MNEDAIVLARRVVYTHLVEIGWDEGIFAAGHSGVFQASEKNEQDYYDIESFCESDMNGMKIPLMDSQWVGWEV